MFGVNSSELKTKMLHINTLIDRIYIKYNSDEFPVINAKDIVGEDEISVAAYVQSLYEAELIEYENKKNIIIDIIDRINTHINNCMSSGPSALIDESQIDEYAEHDPSTVDIDIDSEVISYGLIQLSMRSYILELMKNEILLTPLLHYKKLLVFIEIAKCLPISVYSQNKDELDKYLEDLIRDNDIYSTVNHTISAVENEIVVLMEMIRADFYMIENNIEYGFLEQLMLMCIDYCSKIVCCFFYVAENIYYFILCNLNKAKDVLLQKMPSFDMHNDRGFASSDLATFDDAYQTPSSPDQFFDIDLTENIQLNP